MTGYGVGPVEDMERPNRVRVRVSVASAWQRFHGCDPEYIANVCHGRCCDAPSRPGGTLITIHRSEQAAIEARGGEVRDGRLVTAGLCTFKTADSLCGLHLTPDKPFGCIASPFTLNPSGTLVVRNRYRMLKCYSGQNKGDEAARVWPPAYVAFRASLDLIFGPNEAGALVWLLKAWGDPKADDYDGPATWPAWMPRRSYDMLRENDESKKG